MKKIIAILTLFFILGHSAQAQFRKPLQSSSSRLNTNEALYNIGLVGGINSTYWLHTGGTKTKYHQPFNFGLTGGLVVERMLNSTASVSLDYNVLNFPVGLYDDNGNFNDSKDYFRQLDVNYREIHVQALANYYFSKSTIRPYAFGGLRVSVPMSGNMLWEKTELDPTTHQPINSTTDTTNVAMTAQNTWQWSIGVVAGVGVMFKLNVGNYYFLIKGDLSAHAALGHFTVIKEEPYLYASFLDSFTYEEQNGLSQNVVGAGYIDPYLLGKRFNTDFTAKITFLFPLKKQLKGACMKWGEYD